MSRYLECWALGFTYLLQYREDFAGNLHYGRHVREVKMIRKIRARIAAGTQWIRRPSHVVSRNVSQEKIENLF